MIKLHWHFNAAQLQHLSLEDDSYQTAGVTRAHISLEMTFLAVFEKLS